VRHRALGGSVLQINSEESLPPNAPNRAVGLGINHLG
jgi:hypothetical protein